jgi:hypothetical protein
MSQSFRQLLRDQDSIITRAQLLNLGVSRAAIRHRLVEGRRWQVVLPGVYATFTGPLATPHRLRATLLWGGSGAVLTGATAMQLWGLRYGPNTALVYVLVPSTRYVSSRGFVRVQRSSRMPQPVRLHGRYPTVPAARAVVDGCRPLRGLRDVRAALCEVIQRGLTSCDELQKVIEAGPSAGSALVRRALSDAQAGCRSAPECEVRDLVLSSPVLEEPRWNQPLPGVSDGSRLVPDACWPEASLIVEIDSIEWHRFGDAPERTERRRAQLAALGWTVVPVSPRWLREDPGAARRTIERAYLSGMRRRAS